MDLHRLSLPLQNLLRASPFLALACACVFLASQAHAQDRPGLQPSSGAPTATLPSPWQESLAAFDAADKERPPAAGGILFVGSSTIRLWTHLAADFSQQPVVINRGFGGSTMADCQAFVSQLVLRYRPRQVLVYAGDNDLAQGRTPQEVHDSFRKFVEQVRTELPQTRIAYISIKPSPSRAALLPRMREANALIAGYVATLPKAQYIDIFTPMLDAAGQPRAELFRADALHLNAAGYRLWKAVIADHLEAPSAPAAAAPKLAAQ